MDSLRSYGEQGLAYAKSNPKMIVAALASLVVVILSLVVFFSVRKMDAAKADETQAKYIKNARRATTGLIVMALLAAVAGGAVYYQSKKK